jgi:hypothetical protein
MEYFDEIRRAAPVSNRHRIPGTSPGKTQKGKHGYLHAIAAQVGRSGPGLAARPPPVIAPARKGLVRAGAERLAREFGVALVAEPRATQSANTDSVTSLPDRTRS